MSKSNPCLSKPRRRPLLAAWLMLCGGAVHAAEFSMLAPMPVGRAAPSVALLTNGGVLVAGGLVGGVCSASALLYDVQRNLWMNAASMGTPRCGATFTPLLDGRVLAVGGLDASLQPLASAELYTPTTNTWTATGALSTARRVHTAVRLVDGRVLVTGGYNDTLNGGSGGGLASAERFDPATNSWTPAGTMSGMRYSHATATLADGRVLAVGGGTQQVDLYTPSSNTWSAAAPLPFAMITPSLSLLGNGKVLLAGGYTGSPHNEARTYNPATNTWNVEPHLGDARSGHQAALMSDGRLLLFGGDSTTQGLASSRAFFPQQTIMAWDASMSVVRRLHGSVMLPDGRVLVIGGRDNANVELASVEAYDVHDAATPRWLHGPIIPNWHKWDFTTTQLRDGGVLVVGGVGGSPNGSNTALVDRFDPATNQWTQAASLDAARGGHGAVLLRDGRVLVHGGLNPANAPQSSSRIYDPAQNTWTNGPSSTLSHYYHSLTALRDGRVLAVGGVSLGALDHAELFDPVAGTWTPTATRAVIRRNHIAMRLRDGRVLVAGGRNASNTAVENSAELFDPNTGVWSAAAAPTAPREYGAAVLLQDGRVMVLCGYNGTELTSVEIYDPDGNAWTATTPMPHARDQCGAIVLPDGRVLVSGGSVGGGQSLDSAHLFDPRTGIWKPANSFPLKRRNHGVVLLPDQRVLLVGGRGDTNAGFTTEAFTIWPGRETARVPVIASIAGPLTPTTAVILTGSGFAPVHGADSGTTYAGFGNVPSLQVRHLDTGQMRTLALDPAFPYSNTSLRTLNGALVGFPPGPAYLTVTSTGMRSAAAVVQIVPSAPTRPQIGTAVAGNARARVAFSAPVNDGGEAITSYRATASPDGASATCTAPCNVITVAGLVNNVTYTFHVEAINAAGTSAPSAESNPVTPSTGICASSTLSHNIVLQQDISCAGSANGALLAMASGGQPPYTYSWVHNGSSNPALSGIGPGAYANLVTDDLGCIVAHTYQLVAPAPLSIGVGTTAAAPRGSCNGVATANVGGGTAPYQYAWTPSGQGTATATALCAGAHQLTVTDAHQCTASTTTGIIEPPSAPTLTDVQPGNTYVLVSFTAPASDGGSPILFYRVSCGSVAGDASGSPSAIINLENGVAVSCSVVAHNAAGPGVASAMSAPVTPRAPQQIAFGPAPDLNVGQGATLDVTGGGSGQPLVLESRTPENCSVDTGARLVTGVAVGTCTIAANQAGNAAYLPAPEATLSFDVDLRQYVVTPMVASGGAIEPAEPQHVDKGAAATFAITAPANHLIRVGGSCGGTLTGTRFVTAPVSGDCSVDVDFYTTPAAVSAVLRVPLEGAVRFSFSAPADGGSPILDYTLLCNPGALAVTATASPIVLDGLVDHVIYRCQLTARNAAGSGPPGAAFSAAAGSIGATADLRITVDNGTSFVNGGQPVVYTVTVTNDGPGVDYLGVARFDLPPEFVGGSWTCLAQPGAYCRRDSGSAAMPMTMDLARHGSVQYLVSLTPAPAPETPLSLIVTVESGALPDLDLSNNVASDGPDARGIFRDAFE